MYRVNWKLPPQIRALFCQTDDLVRRGFPYKLISVRFFWTLQDYEYIDVCLVQWQNFQVLFVCRLFSKMFALTWQKHVIESHTNEQTIFSEAAILFSPTESTKSEVCSVNYKGKHLIIYVNLPLINSSLPHDFVHTGTIKLETYVEDNLLHFESVR